MVTTGDAGLGFGDLPQPLDDVSVVGGDLVRRDRRRLTSRSEPPAEPCAMEELAASRLVLPWKGTERRRMIDSVMASASGTAPVSALATDERSAWVTSAQQGIGSFLSYGAAESGLDSVEFRPLDTPKYRVDLGLLSGPSSSRRTARPWCSSPSSVRFRLVAAARRRRNASGRLLGRPGLLRRHQVWGMSLSMLKV